LSNIALLKDLNNGKGGGMREEGGGMRDEG